MYDIFDFTNMIKSPTCFTKNVPPTLNDVILTNQSNYCQNALNFNCGLSDVHITISTNQNQKVLFKVGTFYNNTT
jgi:hypothetical protein